MSYETLSVEEIKAEILRLKKMSDNYKNEEQGVKLTLNSIYGALGNQYFACF
jgi:DNA polymerase elongation subunit (family B)